MMSLYYFQIDSHATDSFEEQQHLSDTVKNVSIMNVFIIEDPQNPLSLSQKSVIHVFSDQMGCSIPPWKVFLVWLLFLLPHPLRYSTLIWHFLLKYFAFEGLLSLLEFSIITSREVGMDITWTAYYDKLTIQQ